MPRVTEKLKPVWVEGKDRQIHCKCACCKFFPGKSTLREVAAKMGKSHEYVRGVLIAHHTPRNQHGGHLSKEKRT